jgi:hypothetical protein
MRGSLWRKTSYASRVFSFAKSQETPYFAGLIEGGFLCISYG